MLDDVKPFARYALGFRSFLKRPLTSAECRDIAGLRLRSREVSFMRILERAVFANPASPYRALFRHARITFEDVAASVRRDGIEATLATLHDRGVWVSLEEFKGRRPIERAGVSIRAQPNDFDNPLLARHFDLSTGGSRGVGRRVVMDFDLLAHDAVYHSIFLAGFGLDGRPEAVWHPVPPAVAGFRQLLRPAKLGAPPERWFSQTRLSFGRASVKYLLFTAYAIYRSRLSGIHLPAPEHVPLTDARRVAEWLANKAAAGTPAVLGTTPSSAVRTCLAARARGLDIGGSFFMLSSEPYTPGKARIIADSGVRGACQYSMAEIGNIGMPCAAPVALDDVHLLTDKVAVVQRERAVGDSGVKVGALFYTTLAPSCPKLMLNVESDDYGSLEQRSCGCLLGRLGFGQHLHSIRSYDKLTSEGMTFIGSELISLVDEILPARFGGYPTDYQFVEEEEAGLSKVSVIVSPRIGPIDEPRLIETVLERLGSHSPVQEMLTRLWTQANALRVVRREPYVTLAAKILPLHVLNRGVGSGPE